MKKIFVASLCLVALAGCDDKIRVDGREYHTLGLTKEYCYDGVIYLKMSGGHGSWGGVKMWPNGNVATCGGK